MSSRSACGAVLMVAALVPSAVPGQDTPPEPTVEQLNKARKDYAKVGATYRAETDPLTKRFAHSFEFASGTRDADLKNLPNPPFPFTLELSFTQVTDEGLMGLKGLRNLTTLSLGSTRVTDEGLKELKDLRNLTSLNLAFTEVTDAGLKELKDLKNLTSLYLSGTQVTDAGLKQLREIGLLHALSRATAKDGKRPTGPEDITTLDLNGTKVTDAGLKELKDLRNLTALELPAAVTDAGLKELKEALPNCRISK